MQQMITSFTSGMNASVGLAFGMTQVGYLGSQAAKFIFNALKYYLKLLFGFDIGQVAKKNSLKKTPNQELLEKTWNQVYNQAKNKSLFLRVYSMIKKVIYLAVCISLGFFGAFLYKFKTN